MTEDGKPVGDDERAPNGQGEALNGQGSTSSGHSGQQREEPPTVPGGSSLGGESRGGLSPHGQSPSGGQFSDQQSSRDQAARDQSAGDQSSGDPAFGGQPSEGQSAGDQASEDQASGTSPQGRIHYQDPDTTTPREPTMAERKARERAERRRDDAERAEQAEAARKSNNRRKVMIGSGVTVGVVALVASFYSAATYSQEANASTQYCAGVDGRTVAEQEKFCDPKYVQENGGSYNPGTGMFFMPIPLGAGGGMHHYRYGYTPGGAAPPSVGSTVPSPNFNKPTDSNVKTKSGNTISRGGFGVGTKSGS